MRPSTAKARAIYVPEGKEPKHSTAPPYAPSPLAPPALGAFGPRAKDRPLCPECGADEARQRGGHHNGFGYWKCSGCEHGWKTVTKGAS
jgi:hypothetical protein